MIPADPEFWKSLTDTQSQAYWGKAYDLDLIAILLRLEAVEEYMKIDWWEEVRLAEEGKPTIQYWDPEAVKAELEAELDAARAAYWIARDRLAANRTPGEALRFIADHYDRIAIDNATFSVSGRGKPDKIETLIIAQLASCLTHADVASCLTHADGTIPCASRVAVLINSLKAAAPYFRPEASDEEKLKLAKTNELYPMLNTCENLKRLGARREAKQLKEFARIIYKEKLFRCGTSKIQEKIRKAVPLLKGGLDKSRSLYALPKRS
jgi:hypothetical protein